MTSRSTKIKISLIVLAILVLFIPFLYPTCRVDKEQLHTSVSSPQWMGSPEGGILTMKIAIENDAGCDAQIESLQFRMYRVVYPDNATEEVDILDGEVVHTTIPAGGNFTMNFAFSQPFSLRPRSILAKITVVLQDGASLEVFDGPIESPPAEQAP
jgi:hypothetical protein